MAKVLFNPTNEDFNQYVGGVEYHIARYPESGHKVRVEDRVANFMMTKLEPRGLQVLEYGDEGAIEERKRLHGLERNADFKRSMVIKYNQQNEQRKHEKLPYLQPTKQVREYAVELGLELLEPYSVKDVEREEARRVKDERDMLKQELADLKKQMDRLLESLGEKKLADTKADDKKAKEDDAFAIYSGMKKAEFSAWVRKEWNKSIPTFSDAIQNDIRVRWEKWSDEPYPS